MHRFLYFDYIMRLTSFEFFKFKSLNSHITMNHSINGILLILKKVKGGQLPTFKEVIPNLA